MNKDDIYPLTIIKDRYNGTYSGGNYVAFNVDHWEIPDPIGGGDFDEENFYHDYKNGSSYEHECGLRIGVGKTAEEALNDLKNKLKSTL